MSISKSPIIGILAIDIDFALRDEFGIKYKYYISSGFVKWIESAGARVVPIWCGQNEDYYRQVLRKLNGVVFPGGQFWFNDPKDGKGAYAAKMIYDIAKEINDEGIHLPIFGICLGFELLFYAASDSKEDSRKRIEFFRNALPIRFTPDFRNSRLFQNVSADILTLMTENPVAYHAHMFIVDEEILEKYKIKNDWHILSTEKDSKGQEFISSVEHKKYPFYGVIFHPEKSQFENYPKEIPHTLDAVKVSQFFANFFVEEARKNNNSFNDDEIKQNLICNFPITFTQPKVPKFQECYLFEERKNEE